MSFPASSAPPDGREAGVPAFEAVPRLPWPVFQRVAKRLIDLVVAGLALGATWWLLLLFWVVATLDCRQNGLFVQTRIGRHGRGFALLKFRTMRGPGDDASTVTTRDDPRVTSLGRRLRRWKLDELPQLVNVLLGDMSLVGPRPDVRGFADRLTGDDRLILAVRPGVTGPATLAFMDEERLLAAQADPDAYNRAVLYPAKVRLNRDYIEGFTLRGDVVWLWRTLARLVGQKDVPETANQESDGPARAG